MDLGWNRCRSRPHLAHPQRATIVPQALVESGCVHWVDKGWACCLERWWFSSGLWGAVGWLGWAAARRELAFGEDGNYLGEATNRDKSKNQSQF